MGGGSVSGSMILFNFLKKFLFSLFWEGVVFLGFFFNKVFCFFIRFFGINL